MVFSGSVDSVDADSGTVVVALAGRNQLGDHVTGTVTVHFRA
jgi:hypothetical protein